MFDVDIARKQISNEKKSTVVSIDLTSIRLYTSNRITVQNTTWVSRATVPACEPSCYGNARGR